MSWLEEDVWIVECVCQVDQVVEGKFALKTITSLVVNGKSFKVKIVKVHVEKYFIKN